MVSVERSFGSRVAVLAGVRLVSVGAAFLTGVLGARLLGSAGVGAAGIAITLATIAVVVCNGGINISTIYLLGRRREAAVPLFGALLPLALAGALLAAALLALLGGTIAPWLAMDGRTDLFVAAAALAAMMLGLEFIGAVLLGLSSNRAYVVAELIRGVGTLVATAIVLMSISRTDVGFVIAALIGQGAATAFGVHRVVRAIGVVRPTINSSVTRDALGIGLRGQVGNVLQSLNLRLDQLLVPAFLSLSSAGVYLIAVRVSEALAQVGNAAASLIFPEVARQDDRSSTAITERTVRVTAIVITVPGLALGLVSDPFLALAFGTEFADGALAMRLLLVAMLPLSVARILAGDLKGRGKPGTVSVAMGLAVVVTILLDVLLIPRAGIEGAAIASVIAYSIAAGALAIAFVMLTGADPRNLLPRTSDVGAMLRYFRSAIGTAGW